MSNRRRSKAVIIGASTVAVVGALIWAGSSDDPDYQALCVDQSGNRIDDDYCDDDGSRSGVGGYAWYYLRKGSRAPALGAKATGGTFVAPSSYSVKRGGISASGGVIKGGFGGSSRGSGVGG